MPNHWLSSSQTLIIGHRGASADAPENSLVAFDLALSQGADGIEFDVTLSSDAIPVIIHDDTVDRTSDGTGEVRHMTAAALGQLALGQGQTIPTLDQLFESLGTRTLYNLELKGMGLVDTGLEAAVARRIVAHGVGDHILISSFNPLMLRRIRKYLPAGVPLGFLRERRSTRFGCRFAHAAADHPLHTLVDADHMAWARANGYRVNVWTVDDPAEARRLVGLGVGGIITNKPGFLRQALEARPT